MGKQVRSFYLDHEVGRLVDDEAEHAHKTRSDLVNELLQEALRRRMQIRYAKAALDLGEGVALLTTQLIVLHLVVLVLL